MVSPRKPSRDGRHPVPVAASPASALPGEPRATALRGGDAASGHLRLTGAGTPPPPVLELVGQPLAGPSDPRWVLALRSAEALQGTAITPEHRERLIRLGRVMGMTPFDANLVIAIVQDQARRGYEASYCPVAGERQLQMVPLPRGSALAARVPGGRAMMTAIAIAAILLTELLLLRWWLGAG